MYNFNRVTLIESPITHERELRFQFQTKNSIEPLLKWIGSHQSADIVLNKWMVNDDKKLFNINKYRFSGVQAYSFKIDHDAQARSNNPETPCFQIGMKYLEIDQVKFSNMKKPKPAPPREGLYRLGIGLEMYVPASSLVRLGS
jgi:hypothetical protein